MSDIMKTDNFDARIDKLDVGHRVEQHIYETNVDGNKERVIETNVDKVLFGVPVSFQERVTEKTVPIVSSRKRETYKDGKLVETVVEELDSSIIKLQPATNTTVVNPLPTPVSVVNPTVSEPVPSNVLTKDDLVKAVKEMLEAVLKSREPVLELPDEPVKVPVVNPVPVVPPQVLPDRPFKEPTPPVQLANTADSWESLAWIILSGELAYCVYNLILKNWF